MDEKKEVKIPTLTLNPNETEVAAAQAVQEQVDAVAEEVKEEVPAEKLGLDSLTPEEQAAVMEFVDKIDVLNTEQILNYGSNAQKNIADFSESALETVKTKDLGQVGEMLGNLVVELKGLNFDEERPGRRNARKSRRRAQGPQFRRGREKGSPRSFQKDKEGYQFP